jgi:hypothetical protein
MEDKMKKLFLFLATLLTLNVAQASIKPLYQDIKLPTQAILEHQTIAIPVVAATTRLATGAATSASVITTVSSFSAQPDVPRVITITPGGTTADVPAGSVTISGTDIKGKALSDTITFLANASTAGTTLKAFKTVSSVVFPIQDGGSATYDIGVGAAFGLLHCADKAGYYAFSVFDGAYETTRGTFVNNATDYTKNVFTPNGTPNGAKNVEIFYVQNFRCL